MTESAGDAGEEERSPPDEAPVSRRSLLGGAFGALAAGLSALWLVPGLGTVLDPLLRRRSREVPFLPVVPESALSGDAPVALPVVGERRDAWTRAANQTLGTVWIRRKGEGQLQVLSAECPHLGCKVGYDGERDRFLCPCHQAEFGPDGSVEAGPAKRGMDPLEARVRDGVVEVQFKRFRTNTEDQVELALG